jgi:FMN-dependent NADH-azoreductase
MSTLIVEYLPGYPVSNTRTVLDHLLSLLPAHEEVRRHDLLAEPAPIFTAESQRAYTKRDMMGEGIDDAEGASLQPFDRLIADVLATDVLVLAFPPPQLLRSGSDQGVFRRDHVQQRHVALRP